MDRARRAFPCGHSYVGIFPVFCRLSLIVVCLGRLRKSGVPQVWDDGHGAGSYRQPPNVAPQLDFRPDRMTSAKRQNVLVITVGIPGATARLMATGIPPPNACREPSPKRAPALGAFCNQVSARNTYQPPFPSADSNVCSTVDLAFTAARQRMHVAALTADRVQRLVMGLFEQQRAHPRTVAALPCRPG
jgi:hypothetical protein